MKTIRMSIIGSIAFSFCDTAFASTVLTRKVGQIVPNLVSRTRSDDPFYLFRPNAVAEAGKFFLDNFHGISAYAVKSNPDPAILNALLGIGMRTFDVASLEEIKTLKKLAPGSLLYFMNPIKSRSAIYAAYYIHGVRNFSVDSMDELRKIQEVLHGATDIRPFVRLEVSNDHSIRKLDNKFGANEEEASKLLQSCSNKYNGLGISFHIGSQCVDPSGYSDAIRYAAEVVKRNRIKIDVLDVGGGFPVTMANVPTPPIQDYFAAIHDAFNKSGLDCELMCEPGRAISAGSGEIIVKVMSRRGSFLYINDGKHGNLDEIGGDLIPPTSAIRLDGNLSENLTSFSLYGPTCDSTDVIPGGFLLPEDIKEGDYIRIANMGAYATASASGFNGFGKIPEENYINCDEDPLVTNRLR